MDEKSRLAALLAATFLTACGGGGGGTSAVASQQSSSSWLAVLRYEPADVTVSLQSTTVPYIYVDSGASNGQYPSPSAFAAAVESANPGLLDGACSNIARISSSVIQFTDAHGVRAPSYVLFFAPKGVGACTQSINLGAEGSRSFRVTVTL